MSSRSSSSNASSKKASKQGKVDIDQFPSYESGSDSSSGSEFSLPSNTKQNPSKAVQDGNSFWKDFSLDNFGETNLKEAPGNFSPTNSKEVQDEFTKPHNKSPDLFHFSFEEDETVPKPQENQQVPQKPKLGKLKFQQKLPTVFQKPVSFKKPSLDTKAPKQHSEPPKFEFEKSSNSGSEIVFSDEREKFTSEANRYSFEIQEKEDLINHKQENHSENSEIHTIVKALDHTSSAEEPNPVESPDHTSIKTFDPKLDKLAQKPAIPKLDLKGAGLQKTKPEPEQNLQAEYPPVALEISQPPKQEEEPGLEIQESVYSSIHSESSKKPKQFEFAFEEAKYDIKDFNASESSHSESLYLSIANTNRDAKEYSSPKASPKKPQSPVLSKLSSKAELNVVEEEKNPELFGSHTENKHQLEDKSKPLSFEVEEKPQLVTSQAQENFKPPNFQVEEKSQPVTSHPQPFSSRNPRKPQTFSSPKEEPIRFFTEEKPQLLSSRTQDRSEPSKPEPPKPSEKYHLDEESSMLSKDSSDSGNKEEQIVHNQEDQYYMDIQKAAPVEFPASKDRKTELSEAPQIIAEDSAQEKVSELNSKHEGLYSSSNSGNFVGTARPRYSVNTEFAEVKVQFNSMELPQVDVWESQGIVEKFLKCGCLSSSPSLNQDQELTSKKVFNVSQQTFNLNNPVHKFLFNSMHSKLLLEEDWNSKLSKSIKSRGWFFLFCMWYLASCYTESFEEMFSHANNNQCNYDLYEVLGTFSDLVMQIFRQKKLHKPILKMSSVLETLGIVFSETMRKWFNLYTSHNITRETVHDLNQTVKRMLSKKPQTFFEVGSRRFEVSASSIRTKLP